MKQTTVAELAERIGGTLDGDGSAVLTGAAPIDRAGPTELAFLANPRYERFMVETKAAAVIVSKRARKSTLR